MKHKVHSQQHDNNQNAKPQNSVNWRHWIILCSFSAFAALLLLQEHRAHLLGLLLYLILILCPLMLLFMYREQKSLDRLSAGNAAEDNKGDKP